MIANYERLSGKDMKKTICLILTLAVTVVSLFAFTSCSGQKKMLKEFTEIVESSSATKIVTIVDVEDKSGEKLGGIYAIEIEGRNSISDYDFTTYRTIEEGAAEFDGANTPDRFKELKGKAYYKDGKVSYDGDAWVTGDPVAVDVRFTLKSELLSDVQFSEDKSTLTAKVSSENAKAVLGADVNSEGDIELTVVTAAGRLISISVSCTTKSGAKMSIRTSYSYNPIQLVFPAEAES